MKESVKNTLVTLLFIAFIGIGALASIILPDKDSSESERRKLAQFPDLIAERILNTKFMSDFETYTLDQFPARDTFRRIKAMMHHYVFLQKDNNDLYLVGDQLSKLDYPLSESSVEKAAKRFEELYKKYFAESGAKAYYSVIPDKNYFLAAPNGYPSVDYNRMLEIMAENTDILQYIDVFPLLSIDDFYRTDSHWKQECISDVADALLSGMGHTPEKQTYTENRFAPFYGVYYGQAALPMEGDTLIYLTNDMLSGATVYNHETGKTGGIYELSELESADPYEMYLYGAAALLEIENPAAKEKRELVIFRDSCAASITPLLLSEYSKITMVDIRYVHGDTLAEYVDFSATDDVLFLYSTMVLNSSSMLR